MVQLIVLLGFMPSFFGFSVQPSIMEACNKFGSPVEIYAVENSRHNGFIFKKKDYIIDCVAYPNGYIYQMSATGLVSDVAYKNVTLGSTIKTVYSAMGKPGKILVQNENETHFVFKDCVVVFTKIGKRKEYRATELRVFLPARLPR